MNILPKDLHHIVSGALTRERKAPISARGSIYNPHALHENCFFLLTASLRGGSTEVPERIPKGFADVCV
jgi:hypothetical protein